MMVCWCWIIVEFYSDFTNRIDAVSTSSSTDQIWGSINFHFNYYFVCQALMLSNVNMSLAGHLNKTSGLMSFRHLKDSTEVFCVAYVQKERTFAKHSHLHLRTCTGNLSDQVFKWDACVFEWSENSHFSPHYSIDLSRWYTDSGVVRYSHWTSWSDLSVLDFTHTFLSQYPTPENSL